MRIMNLSELEQYTEELSKKYNVKASITEQGKHFGGMWITEWYLIINNQKILVGSDYDPITIDELKSNIENTIKENKT